MTNNDPLLDGLAGLATEPPAHLVDRVAARWVTVDGPLGELFVAYTDHGIAYLRPADAMAADGFRNRFKRPLLRGTRPPAGLVPALRAGNSGELEFDLREMSAFQAAVLRAARGIPRGELRPYTWIARRIDRPRAVRAVGSALATNPVPLLIPCHRVTRADGSPGQYIFGQESKQALLRREGVDLEQIRELTRRGTHFLGSDTTGVACYPTCRSARRITAAHRREFQTMDQARAAGYRPCRHCHPVG